MIDAEHILSVPDDISLRISLNYTCYAKTDKTCKTIYFQENYIEEVAQVVIYRDLVFIQYQKLHPIRFAINLLLHALVSPDIVEDYILDADCMPCNKILHSAIDNKWFAYMCPRYAQKQPTINTLDQIMECL